MHIEILIELMTNLEQALELLSASAKPFNTEKVKLEKSCGRILAENIVADRDYPPFNRASVDGYAISMNDVEKKITQYRVVETIFAGGYGRFKLRTGECYKIMTGAAVPESANALFRVEEAIETENYIVLPILLAHPFLNISKKGEDVANGKVILQKNKVINIPVISTLAAVGKAEVEVVQMPNVVIITTGDEVVDVDESVELHQIRNSNAYILRAMLAQWQIKPSVIRHIRDSHDAILRAVNKYMDADIIITTGGVSMGDSDYMPHVFESAGIEKLFHKLNIKPGKPVWVGKKENGPMVFGLPGNPFSVQTVFTVLVQHYLNVCSGSSVEFSNSFKIGSERTKSSKLNEFFTVRRLKDSNTLVQVNNNGSGDITAGTTSDGIALHPAEVDVLKNGSTVKFFPFSVS